MRRTLSVLPVVAAVTALAACGGGAEGDAATVVVGATPVPHAEILNFVDEELAPDAGIDLEIVEFTDYVQPNAALAEGEIDANFFQHVPYLDEQKADLGYDFDVVTGVHLEPLGIYSQKVEGLEGLGDGAQVIIPNDPSNSGRALNLLAEEGLIDLDADAGITATVQDVTDAKGLEISELDAASLPRSLPDADLAVVNTNFALEAGLNPGADALATERPEDNPYVNVLVAAAADADDEAIATLADLLASDEVATFIEETYEGAVIPAS